LADAGESGGLKKGDQTIAKMQMRSDVNLHVQVPLHPHPSSLSPLKDKTPKY